MCQKCIEAARARNGGNDDRLSGASHDPDVSSGSSHKRTPGEFWAENQGWLVPVILLGAGFAVGNLLATVSDALGRSTRFGNWTVFDHAGDFLRIAGPVVGLIAAITHAVHRHRFGTLFAELLLGVGIMWMVVPWSGETQKALEQFPPYEGEARGIAPGLVRDAPGATDISDPADVIPVLGISDALESPDVSDVDHLATTGNVVVAKPGQALKHPILAKNEGERWWRARALCRENGNLDSSAIVSAEPCIPIPIVPPGENVELTLEITAPLRRGTYRALWKMVDRDGTILFPDADPVTLHVIVR
jgi:hypothetical protein